MVDRQRNCRVCGGQFSYPISRGTDRLYCTKQCENQSRVDASRRRPIYTCTVEGCQNQTRPGSRTICEMHHGRMRRLGSLDLPAKSDTYPHSHGYVVRITKGHPLSTPGQINRIYDHRVAFYAKAGDGPFDCHHCGIQVGWDNMHVDHLNDVRDDNRPDNLVASCAKCNQKRGQHKMRAASRERFGIEFNGTKLLPSEWAARLGTAPGSINKRIAAGWSIERAVSEPRGPTGPKRRT